MTFIITKLNIFLLLLLLDKQIQYPSLDTVQNDLAMLKFKSTLHNGLTTNIKSNLDHRDNYSSEEDIDSQEFTHTPINKPQLPIFDRSTKVLTIKIIN